MKLSSWEAHPIFGSRTTTSPKTYLYHYTTVERAACIALMSSLALSPLGPMNDPRESQVRQLSIVRVLDEPTPYPPVNREEYELAVWERRATVRLACLTEDDTDGEPGSAAREDRRGFSHSRMWTQYAAGQTGVCLAFDRAELIVACKATFGERFTHGRVEYIAGFDRLLADAEMVRFDRPDPVRHHEEAVLPSLLVKNDDWRSEREYRLLVDDWGAEACLIPISHALKGVALGSGFMPHQVPIVEAIAGKFALGDGVAHMVLNCGVLQPWPARRPDGAIRLWTDVETRSGTAFEPEG